MRAIIKTVTLLFIFMLVTFPRAYASVEGYYYNPRLHESIRIIEQHRDVIIKGLFDDNRITRFEKVGSRTYEDRYGNVMVCEDRNTVKLKRWRTRDYIRFDKVDDHRGKKDWNRYHDYDDDCDIRYDRGYDDRYNYRLDDRYDNRYDDQYDDKSDHRRYDDRKSKNKDNGSSTFDRGNQSIMAYGTSARFVGTWDVRNGKYNSVAIIDTRDGLKAKFSGTSNWVTYTQSQSRPNEYLDERGNRYIFDREDEGKWYPIEKGKKVIELKKISSEVKY